MFVETEKVGGALGYDLEEFWNFGLQEMISGTMPFHHSCDI